MVKSMTAYARQEEKIPLGIMAIELRSVNHRFLEMSLKIPEELRALEMKLRARIKKNLKRGKLDLVMHLHRQQADNQPIAFNHDLAEQIARTLHDIDKVIYNAAPVNAIDILNWPGVMDSQAIEQDTIKDALFALLDKAIEELQDGKKREGAALEQMILQRVSDMRKITGMVRQQMPELLQLQKKRLEEKLQILKADMDNERLEQEMVYMAQKSDVAEELDRLDTHLDEISRVLDGNEAIGRRLDFLMQELNREANTLGSKSIANVMTQASVDMKVLIEQMREQIQNIE
ncbi:MAG: YicC family protein [gamma proteobacterium symbiont of Bathyaustriella thionipta]|nr:YicC family protein [gamma proteobacterium symbiont of Bathyaustriella thionipta]MCU7949976.1 YicC family protein [gamma proteobacterium symbiont of Bathyaustriella thionipta]MCU7954774.1 YicC family protein [gamma proteobacterium symbiont of Bathyaustriella thionipta]MCU7956554.1 YicC family protein [gamma proteobacterium symbiont of Bathyaustriella thionipta]MCU7966549.1 YicC family protein [gamma proteobacterium symbiont of Bathyaustriella thionipta]